MKRKETNYTLYGIILAAALGAVIYYAGLDYFTGKKISKTTRYTFNPDQLNRLEGSKTNNGLETAKESKLEKIASEENRK